MVVECVKDNDYHPQMAQWIENFPIKGEAYTVRKRVHTQNGLGYLLEEITNPIMPNGEEPNFHHTRFREIKVDIQGILDEAAKETVNQ